VKASLSNSSTGLGNGLRVPLDGHNLTRRTNQSGYQHRHISYPRSEFQNALPGSNAGFTKKSFGDGSDTRSLSDQAIVLGVGVPKRVISGATAHCHFREGLLRLDFISLRMVNESNQ
jgi:hypothetical protein